MLGDFIRFRRLFALLLLLPAVLPKDTWATEPLPPTSLDHAKVLFIAQDQASIQVLHGNQRVILGAKSPEIRALLKTFSEGDIIDIRYTKGNGSELGDLRNASVEVKEIGILTRILALCLVAAGLLLIFWLLLRSRLPDLAIGTDNRYSKSKFQMALWFFVLLVCYVALTGLRGLYAGLAFIGGVGIPQNLLYLSGLSALSFAGAKAITQSRVDAMARDPARLAMANAVQPGTTDAVTWRKIEGANGTARPRFPFDLLHDDEGRVDLGDFQMMVVTLLAVVVYVLTVFNDLGSIQFHRLVSLPDVDSTILAAFGLGQGTYLVKKLVGDVGGGRPSPPPNPQLPAPNPQPPAPVT
jgi:hypothetical protein